MPCLPVYYADVRRHADVSQWNTMIDSLNLRVTSARMRGGGCSARPIQPGLRLHPLEAVAPNMRSRNS